MIGNSVERANDILQKGGLVAIPTETVYGLAGNGYNSIAVLNIFKAKQRPSFDPLILHFSSIERVEEAVQGIPENARMLAEKFWPGPLTLVLPKKDIVPDEVSSGLNTVAVRVPNHPLSLKLLKSLPFPLAAPSANPFGYVSPTNAMHVESQLGNKIDYILDGGSCEVGVESSIVSFEGDEPILLREGGISQEQIQEAIGPIKVQKNSSSKPTAPGMLESHYAPISGLTLVDDLKEFTSTNKVLENCGFICFEKAAAHEHCSRCIVLSANGEVEEAATNLFATLRTLDDSNLNHIYAERVPNVGIGRAINDRLKRASA